MSEKIKCDICGRFISIKDLLKNKAKRVCISVDSDYSIEEYETFCKKCNKSHD